MNVKILKLVVDKQSISPALTIAIDIEFTRHIYAPISISGRLMTEDNRVVSFLTEYQINSDKYFGLQILSRTDKEKLNRGRNTERSYCQLTAQLTYEAIEYIELQREVNPEKSVKFYFDFIVKYLELPIDPPNLSASVFFQSHVQRFSDYFTIQQSDWIRNYSPNLGIGKFLLIELRIPSKKHVPIFWQKLYNQLCDNLQDMEHCLQEGDWEKAILYARRFFENAKIGDKKPAHKKFKEEFEKLMLADQHSDQGIENLHTAIWQIHEFISKYTHNKDKMGNLISMPIPAKEDAYFAYTVSVGFLNLLAKKIDSNQLA